MTPARRGEIHDLSCRFWAEEGFDRLPVEPRTVIARHHWGLVPYSRLAELQGLTAADFFALCCSRDGFTIFNGRNFCIAYNGSVVSAARLRFTLMHEIGHIALGHLARPHACLPWEPEDPEIEWEASFFAGCVLAPSAAIRRGGLNTPALLAAGCGISAQAAARRLAEHRLSPPRESDRLVESRLSGYFRRALRRRADMGAADIICDDGRAFPSF